MDLVEVAPEDLLVRGEDLERDPGRAAGPVVAAPAGVVDQVRVAPGDCDRAVRQGHDAELDRGERLGTPAGRPGAEDGEQDEVVRALRSWALVRVERVADPISRDTGPVSEPGLLFLVGVFDVSPCAPAEVRAHGTHHGPPNREKRRGQKKG